MTIYRRAVKGVPVPLSEHEQRLLEEMERALHADDPRLASTLRHGGGRAVNGRGVMLGAIGVLAGLTALLGGVITSFVLLGVFGFLLMLGGVLLIGAAMRGPKNAASASAETAAPGYKSSGRTPKRATQKSQGSFMSRVEERWRRRRESEGQ
jgi:hypothetical protein